MQTDLWEYLEKTTSEKDKLKRQLTMDWINGNSKSGEVFMKILEEERR